MRSSMPGPGASAILGDLGADIVKIESGTGDPERNWTTLGRINLSLPNGESLFFQLSNRNKRGIYLDIEKEKGREVLHRLIKEADVFITNLRKTTKLKLGIGRGDQIIKEMRIAPVFVLSLT